MKKKLATIILTLCLMLLATVPALAEDTIHFGGEGEVKSQTVTVTVTVDQAGVCSGQVKLAYDAKVVELISADYGTVSGQREVKSLNIDTDAHEIFVGFADLKAAEAGSVIKAEFKLIGNMPKEGIKFPVVIEEWSNEEQNALLVEAEATKYDIVVKEKTTVIEPKPEPKPDPKPGNTKPSEGGNEPTGDQAPVELWMMIAVVAAAGIVVLFLRRKKAAK